MAQEMRNELIEEYRGYARSIVAAMIRRLNLPANRFDELVAAGILGLVEAASRFESDGRNSFKNYAFLRIRGAVIDSIRDSMDVTREAYRYAKALKAANELREWESSVDPADRPAPEEGLANVLDFATKAALALRLSMDECKEEIAEIADEHENAEEAIASYQTREEFRQIVAALPERERYVIEEYYFGERSFSEIARSGDGMSRSWVCRLHARGLELLKQRLQEGIGDGP